ncbi:hypothetical protein M8818_004840 [Zalaria obscura]|uniref:Uncharacterized protein n=1 Tax=Zalaria obscura TaxID=2024903 RepID=A0ACC3SAQ0_9PEZI
MCVGPARNTRGSEDFSAPLRSGSARHRCIGSEHLRTEAAILKIRTYMCVSRAAICIRITLELSDFGEIVGQRGRFSRREHSDEYSWRLHTISMWQMMPAALRPSDNAVNGIVTKVAYTHAVWHSLGPRLRFPAICPAATIPQYRTKLYLCVLSVLLAVHKLYFPRCPRDRFCIHEASQPRSKSLNRAALYQFPHTPSDPHKPLLGRIS